MSSGRWCIAWALLAATPHGVAAQQGIGAARSAFTAIATEKLGQLGGDWADRGFRPSGPAIIGLLAAKHLDSLSLLLDPGRRYVVIGMCDTDCHKLSLAVSDPSGKPVGGYSQGTTHPFIQIQHPDSGSYRLDVRMANCSTSPCYYGVQLLEAEPDPVPAPP
jgi:hypothetical protein